MKYIFILAALTLTASAQVYSGDSVHTTYPVIYSTTTGWHCIHYTWDDLRAPAQSINPAGGSVAPTVSPDGTLLFASTKNTDIGIAFQMPHDFAQGQDSVHIHLHWCKTTNDTGFVRWQMKYSWANIGDAFAASSAWLNGWEEVPLAGDQKHRMFEWTPIPAAGKTLSSFILVQIERQSSGAPDDTYPADAKLLGVDVRYKRCIFSSNGEVTNGQ